MRTKVVTTHWRGSANDGALDQMIKIVAGNSSGSGSSMSSATGVTWPLANMVVLLMGLDSSAVGIKALRWRYRHLRDRKSNTF
jgi:hypothetical protein